MMVDLNVVIAGAAGEGVQTVGEVLARAIAGHGYPYSPGRSSNPESGEASNSSSIRIRQNPTNAPALEADILLALNDGAAVKYGRLIQQDGILIAPRKRVGTG
ncbi:MAG: 2-oxoacid:acceptor oxidoreductase family protein [Desulfobacterales bacterium]|nr:2-oxoacid:acceptor oxidoreductase family protein [Desulfobacterales bacterium]